MYERPKTARSHPQFENVWKKYKEGSDEYRNERFKFLFNIKNAGWVVRAAVSTLGGFRPVILGKVSLICAHSSVWPGFLVLR
jgi:hypothetical protein